jgi:hypothetical protein
MRSFASYLCACAAAACRNKFHDRLDSCLTGCKGLVVDKSKPFYSPRAQHRKPDSFSSSSHVKAKATTLEEMTLFYLGYAPSVHYVKGTVRNSPK